MTAAAGGGGSRKGRIPDRDITAIREQARIEDVVGDHVQLRRAGADSLKGLCPFHDEKSPSFHVRPNHGHFHCFGCGEGGDVYAFIQKVEHVSFVEAVELLADRIGYTVTYTGGGNTVQRDRGSRSRLVAANAAAQEFYSAALESDEAAPARRYLTERNFDAGSARHFGCGFAPSGWDSLTKHLIRKGFEFKELEAAGLSREGRRGPMDRFHRRLLWPIRSVSGETVGFGARRIFDDDPIEAKYVNTPETTLYKKSSVLFGIDLAKRDIAKGHQAVVVEGYTDVMAMHLAGVTTAVASCGTAFGDEHLSMLRRLMMDDKFFRGELIYVFDGDAAGQAAALKAFAGEQNLAGQSFVAVAADGMDPCDLRLASGDAALRDLVARRTPLFEFAIRTALTEHDLDNAEGRVAALRRFRLGHLAPVIGIVKGLTDPICGQLMGQTAENLAYRFEITREQMDDFAARSHQRVLAAQAAGHFDEIVPLIDRDGTVHALDDGVRADSTAANLAKLRPFFDKKYGRVTAGNSSQITDGAAWLILASEAAVEQHGLEPIGKIVDSQWAGLAPEHMGLGPVHAATPILQRHALGLNDLDAWEINEAFAAQVIACLRAWDDAAYCRDALGLDAPLGALDDARLNIDGGAIAQGHPVGASGARIVLHLLNVLRREGKTRGMASICIGGGQGGAMLVEAV